MGLSMKKTIAVFCADQIDVITKVAVITNSVIKRVHCTYTLCTIGRIPLNVGV